MDDKGKLKCTIVEYPLDDEAFRKELNSLGFICYVGGLRYKVCLDKPGLCRFTYTQKKFVGIPIKKIRHEEYIPIEDNKRLVNADAKCYTLINDVTF